MLTTSHYADPHLWCPDCGHGPFSGKHTFTPTVGIVRLPGPVADARD